jgi:hypothetical protein
LYIDFIIGILRAVYVSSIAGGLGGNYTGVTKYRVEGINISRITSWLERFSIERTTIGFVTSRERLVCSITGRIGSLGVSND